MIRYEVVDLSRDGTLMSLLDAAGQLHVARLRGAEVQRDEVLHGRPAKLGAHLLLAEGRRTPLRVSFESLACSQDQALALMHPAALMPVPMPGASPPWPGDAPAWADVEGRRR